MSGYTGYSDYIAQKKKKIDYTYISIFLIGGKETINSIVPYTDIGYDEVIAHLEKIKNKDPNNELDFHKYYDVINFVGGFLDFNLDQPFYYNGNDNTEVLKAREKARSNIYNSYMDYKFRDVSIENLTLKITNCYQKQGLPFVGWCWDFIMRSIVGGGVTITKHHLDGVAFCRNSPCEYPVKKLKVEDIKALASLCADYILRLESLIADKQDLQKFIESNMDFFNPIMESFRSYFLDDNGRELSHDELLEPFCYSPY